eukprot:7056543-Alexandrium_andersonii.AAC.1
MKSRVARSGLLFLEVGDLGEVADGRGVVPVPPAVEGSLLVGGMLTAPAVKPRRMTYCPGSAGRSGVGLVVEPLFQVRKKRADLRLK